MSNPHEETAAKLNRNAAPMQSGLSFYYSSIFFFTATTKPTELTRTLQVAKFSFTSVHQLMKTHQHNQSRSELIDAKIMQ
jgi:hypothetical protein